MVMALSFSVTTASKPRSGEVEGVRGTYGLPMHAQVLVSPHAEIRRAAKAPTSTVLTMNTQRARLAPGNNRPVATVNIGDSRAILPRQTPRFDRRDGNHRGGRLQRRHADRDPLTVARAGRVERRAYRVPQRQGCRRAGSN